MAVTTGHAVNSWRNFHRICRLSRVFRLPVRLKSCYSFPDIFITCFKQGHPYDMRIGYPAVIGYIYRPFRDVYAYARNPVNRGNEPGNRVSAILANHIIYYKRCLPDEFTPGQSAALK